MDVDICWNEDKNFCDRAFQRVLHELHPTVPSFRGISSYFSESVGNLGSAKRWWRTVDFDG